MAMSMKEIQTVLKAAGLYSGKIDGLKGPQTKAATEAFQRMAGLVDDGIAGPKTQAALQRYQSPLEPAGPPVNPFQKPQFIPIDWLPEADIEGIVVHWTAGTNKASTNDKEHYHFLINGDGTLVRGIPSVDLNSKPKVKSGYAAHTFNNNTGWIGISLCCMGGDGVSENPFRTGKYPMTRTQWDALPHALADLCRWYGIKVTDKKVLSHAEVQPNLGIKQKGKWDITRLSFDLSVVGAKACGDIFRSRTKALLT